jgi:CRISPR-associated endonuclease Csn1
MRYLGIDIGTNSIGWAIREESLGEECQILQHGVRIFSKGVGEGKAGEFSLAAERTTHRSSRKRNYRKKMRKVNLLRLLIENQMCPLSHEELNLWAQYQKGTSFEYPQTENFLKWFALNPYECRLAATKGKVSNYELGRALYHICQRRGFKSGKKDAKENEKNEEQKVFENFKEKNSEKLLIQHLYSALLQGEVVRHRPTPTELIEQVKNNKEPKIKSSRLLYEEELAFIFKQQKLTNGLDDSLENAILHQRPLKSQKHSVGKCTLEKKKIRAKMSSPTYELFRLHQQINNVLVKTNYDTDQRQLDEVEKQKIMPLFFRKSKELFDFEEIGVLLNKEAKKSGVTYTTNYDGKKVSAANCPTITRLKEFCGENWEEFNHPCTYLHKGEEKTANITAHDIWHVWESFDDPRLIKEWAKNRLDFDEERAEKFSKVQLKDGYTSLSETAMRKINVFLQQGYIYSLSVFLANIENVIGKENWDGNETFICSEIDFLLKNDKQDGLMISVANAFLAYLKEKNKGIDLKYLLLQEDLEKIEEKLKGHFGANTWLNKMDDVKRKEIFDQTKALVQKHISVDNLPYFVVKKTLKVKIQDWLLANFDISETSLSRIYHPSAIETYKEADGKLGSPMTASIRNPMAMKALHELRHLVNDLIEKEYVDKDTIVIVEMSRDLNDANKRKAIQNWQKKNQKENDIDKDKVREIFRKHHNLEDYSPSETEILKCKLWREQAGKCIYTGKTIGCADLFNGELWDLEHTLPRSKSFDNSHANMTLCCADYNRKVKKSRAPFELYELGQADRGAIELRLAAWKDKIEKQTYIVNKNKFGSGNEDKKSKDDRIQRRHEAQLELEYWKNKYNRFFMTEIKEGFKNSQMVDTGIITKYAKLYLKSYFSKVEAVKGGLTAEFRKRWGLQEEREIKSRSNHNHHLMDAIVISCMTRRRYNALAEYYQDKEKYLNPTLKKPWATFNQDIAKILDSVIVSHSFKDNTLKQTKKRVFGENGKVIKDQFVQGKGIRGSLHKDTFYGKIIAPSDGKEHFVKRVAVADMKDTDISKIVDVNIKKLFEAVGLKKAQTDGIFIPSTKPDGKPTPIKKIRIFQDSMSPMPIKKHSHNSATPGREHKHFSYAANDENYALAIYRNGKDKDFELVNLLKFAKKDVKMSELFPIEKYKTDKKGFVTALPIYKVLQSGKTVLLLENEQDTINWDDKKELKDRLFVIRGLSIMNLKQAGNTYVYSVISLLRVNAAKKISEYGAPEGGEFKLGEQKSPFRKLLNTQFLGLLEGADFILTPSGEIEPLL